MKKQRLQSEMLLTQSFKKNSIGKINDLISHDFSYLDCNDLKNIHKK
jgi:hypothetical protein